MGRALTLSACPSGLRIGAGLFFKNIFVPWQDIEVTRGTFLRWQSATFRLGTPAINTLTVPAHVANSLAVSASHRWPEVSLSKENVAGAGEFGSSMH
jgi:hypothetical protein